MPVIIVTVPYHEYIDIDHPKNVRTSLQMKRHNKDNQKETELMLKDSNELIENIAALTPDLITIQEAETNLVIYRNNNDFWKELIDLGLYQADGAEKLTSIVHLDHRSFANTFVRERKLLKDGELKEIELRLVNHSWIRVRSKVFKRSANGSATEIISFISNITASKKTEQESRSEKHQSILAEVSQRLAELDNITDTTTFLGEKIARHFNAKWCVFRERSSDSKTFAVSGWNAEDVTSLLGTHHFLDDYLSIQQTHRDDAGQLTIVSDTQTDPRTSAKDYSALGIRSFVIVPLSPDGLWEFQLSVIDNKTREWRKDEIILLKELTSRIWMRLEQARAEEAIRLSEERMRGLKEAYQSVINGARVEDSLRRLTQLVTRETSGEARTAFCVTNDDGTVLHPMYGAGNMPDAYLNEINNITIGNALPAIGLAIPTGQPVITTDVFEDPQLKPWRTVAEKYDYKSCWSFPIRTREDKAVGTFGMYFRTKREAIAQELILGEIIAQSAALIMSYNAEAIKHSEAKEALSKSESLLTLLVEAVPTAIGLIDLDGRIIVCNTEMQQYLPKNTVPSTDEKQLLRWKGWNADGSAIAITDFDFMGAHPLRGKVVLPGIEMLYTHNDGTEKWTRVSSVPMKDKNGEITGTLIAITDINELKRSKSALQELNARLQEADKVKTAFFHNVSHEFRTPLTLLLGPLEDVIKTGATKMEPDDLQKLQLSHRNAIRLQKLVNTLLDFTRIEAGKLEAFYQPTDFKKFNTELAANFRSVVERAGLKYIVKADDIDEAVYVNRDMWEKIVFNLLSNAFKFTHKGKIEVLIRNKKRQVELRVKDTGTGIAANNIERIFERFTRIEGTKARTYEGVGIGLALVRELVLAHKGTIKVKSEEGSGTEFIVSIQKGKSHLPSKQIYESREQLPATSVAESFVEQALGWLPEDAATMRRHIVRFQYAKGKRVLIVEDNADMREYLITILSDDYQVLAVDHGQKLLDLLNDGVGTDLILADVMMPEVNGFEMVQRIKTNPKLSNIPIILLSARTSEALKIKGLDIGADDYLVKPFSAKELLALIRSRINRSRKFAEQHD